MSTSTSSSSSSNNNGNGMSQRKLEANRANAQKSTGPRTDAGKRKSSLNAQTHGLRARLSQQTLVCDHEKEDFQALSEALHEELNPQTPLQQLLAQRLALLAWKMRRTAAAEAALLNKYLVRDREYQQRENDKKLRRNPHAKTKPLPTAADLIAEHAQAPAKNNPWLTLHRYDQATQREFHKTLKQYQSLQRQEMDELDEDLIEDVYLHSDGPNEPTDPTPLGTCHDHGITTTRRAHEIGGGPGHPSDAPGPNEPSDTPKTPTQILQAAIANALPAVPDL